MKAECPKLDEKIEKQRRQNEALKEMSAQYDLPTVDDYLELKILEEKEKARKKVEERKANLRKLQLRRAKSEANISPRKGQAKDTKEADERPRVVKGKTFNIEFKLVDD